MRFRSLAALIFDFDAEKHVERREVAMSFGAHFSNNPDFNIEDAELAIRGEIGLLLYYSFIALVSTWNAIAVSKQQLDLPSFVQRVKDFYLNEVDRMEQLVSASRRLHEVFTPEWFENVRREIRDWNASEPLRTEKHGAFVTHLQDQLMGESVIGMLDEAFYRLSAATGKKLAKKLREVPRQNDAYISVVFETIALAKFEKILDYEPRLPTGRQPEARVEVAGMPMLVEARATQDMSLESGAFDPDERGAVLAAKAREKYADQLKGITEPAVLLFALNIGVNDLHVRAMLQRIVADPDSSVLSAIVFADSFHATRFRVWLRPGANHPLTVGVWRELRRLFSATVLSVAL
jgi:hypothetical protein